MEVPTIISFSSFQRTVEHHVDIPVPGGGGSISGLQGFSSGQSSTALPSKKRISERIMEQIVDPVSRGGPPGSSSSHFPAGVEERADELGEGVFRTFPQNKKSAKLGSHSGSALLPESSPSTLAAQLEDSPSPVVEYTAPAPAVTHSPTPVVESIAPAPALSEAPAPGVELFSPAPAVLPRGDEVTLLFRKTTECRPQLRVHARRTRPLHFAFKAYCRCFGLQESQVRFSCDGLLSPDHSPDQLGLEDGDVIEAEEVYEEDEEEEEDDDDYDEFDGTESRFSAGFRPMQMCRWFSSGNCRQGVGVYVRSLGERAAPPSSSWSRAVTTFYGPLYLAVTCSILFLAEEYRVLDFSGDHFRYGFRMLHSFGRQWIHALRQSTRLSGRISHYFLWFFSGR